MKKNKNGVQATGSRKLFLAINYVVCILVALICLAPVVHVLSVSLSSRIAVDANRVYFRPVMPTLDNYRYMLNDSQFFHSYLISIERCAVGWLFTVINLVLIAYPLSLPKNRFPARKFFTWFFVITMIFSGGMVPTYLVVRGTGLVDSFWALIIPTCVPVYDMILMKNYIRSLPPALSEAAYIDGAGHLYTLIYIILPLSLPAVASISLFILLWNWNDYFSGMVYIRNMELKPLQTYLRSIILVSAKIEDIADLDSIKNNLTQDATNGAKIFLSLLPIMIVYPFLQKYFVKGIVRGGVKE